MEDLTKREYGELKVIGLAKNQSKKGFRLWSCRCVCGNIIEEVTGKLKYGHTTSCGCMKHKRAMCLKRFGSDHRLWCGHGQLSGTMWHRILASAAKRDIEVTIDIEYAWELFQRQEG